MSVYTPVSTRQIETFLEQYELGAARSLQGISEGIENTNYFLDTEKGQYVLTLFEQHSAEDLPYFLQLMAHLAKRGIPSAHPIANRKGDYLSRLNNRPTVIVQRLQGLSLQDPTRQHCAAIGRCMAMIHVQGADFPLHKVCSRDYPWCRETADKVMPRLSPAERELIQKELSYQEEHDFLRAPGGVIHADLFRDNALFIDDTLSGVIDFYYACNWPFIYDLAVTTNDWCNSGKSRQDRDNARALLQAYREVREVGPDEIELWPVVLRAAALRFWLSRLEGRHFPRPGQITHVKDPELFHQRLQRNIHNGEQMRKMWQLNEAA